MSIWGTISEIRVKKYIASHIDPRKKQIDYDVVDFATVQDYVFDDSGVGETILPYLRMGVGMSKVLLTEKQAKQIIVELQNFVDRPKWRKR